MQLVIIQILTCLSVFAIGYFLFEHRSHKLIWHEDLVYSFLFNGILASFVLMIVHTYFQRFTSPVKAALIFSLEPIFASVFAIIFVNEILNNREYIGAAILILGVLTSELGPLIRVRRVERFHKIVLFLSSLGFTSSIIFIFIISLMIETSDLVQDQEKEKINSPFYSSNDNITVKNSFTNDYNQKKINEIDTNIYELQVSNKQDDTLKYVIDKEAGKFIGKYILDEE